MVNLRLLKALARRGWRVQAAVLFERPSQPRVDVSFYLDFLLDGFPARGIASKMVLPWRIAVHARNADLVIGGLELAATNYGFLAARLSRRPFLSWTHTAFAQHQYTAGPLDRWVSHWVYRHCRNVVFPSSGALASLAKALGGQPLGVRWHVIENFLEGIPPKSSDPPDKELYRKPVLIGVGRLVREKAFDRLIRAHAVLRAQGIDHHLIILGDGPERERLQRLVQELSLEASAFLPGHVSDPWPWLSYAHVFAMCSQYEGLPLVLLEAMAAGLPCVAMDCESGPREILQDGAFGLLTSDGDEGAFYEALARVFCDPQLRVELSTKAQLRAKHYSKEHIVPRWEGLFHQLIGRHNRWS